MRLHSRKSEKIARDVFSAFGSWQAVRQASEPDDTGVRKIAKCRKDIRKMNDEVSDTRVRQDRQTQS